MPQKKKDKIFSRLQKRYRVVIEEDKNLEHVVSFKFVPLVTILVIVASFTLLIFLIYSLLAFTPLRKAIPGYPSAQTQADAMRNALKVDSLEQELRVWNLQLNNFQRVVLGLPPLPIDSLLETGNIAEAEELVFEARYAYQDSLLKAEVASGDQYDVTVVKRDMENIEGILFFPPVKGHITEGYNPAIAHPYVDIAVKTNTSVCETLDGTIISSVWNDDTGWTIQIQHSGDLISIYKHCTKTIKKSGEKVSAGTPIAFAGNAGNISTGSHLHFELWYRGAAVDPETYIRF